MEIHPTIRDEIPLVDGKITSLNMSFFSPDSPIILRGGTAGNIAFSISYLKKGAILYSVVGSDFQRSYGHLLEEQNVILAVQTEKDDITARSYQIMDPNKEQIIIWQPNAIRLLESSSIHTKIDLLNQHDIKVAIFSPGSAESTMKHMREVKELLPDCIMIFDPGQMVMTYTVQQFTECLRLADIVIMNDAEALKSRERGLNQETFLDHYPQLLFIETLGSKGAHYFLPDGTEWLVSSVPNIKLVEPTGAGDAFRGGIISAFLENNDWIEAGKTGAALASLCIESSGAQGYGNIEKNVVQERVKLISITKIK